LRSRTDAPGDDVVTRNQLPEVNVEGITDLYVISSHIPISFGSRRYFHDEILALSGPSTDHAEVTSSYR